MMLLVRILVRCFSMAIVLNDGRLEGSALQAGDMEHNVLVGGGGVPVVVPAAVPLAGLAA